MGRAQTASGSRRTVRPGLHNVRIRAKFSLILVIPIAALVGFAAVSLAGAGQDVYRARQVRQYSELSQRAAAFGAALQTERTLAAVFLTSSPQDRDAAKIAYQEQVARTNKKANAYQKTRADLKPDSASMRKLLNRIAYEAAAMKDLRNKVLQPGKVSLSGAIFSYRILIADLLTYRESLADIAGDEKAANLVRGATAVASYTEFVSQEEVVGTTMLGSGSLTQSLHESFISALAGQADSLHSFSDVASQSRISELDRMLAGKDVGKDADPTAAGPLAHRTTAEVQNKVRASQRYEGDIRRASAGQPVTLTGGAGDAQWVSSMSIRVALTREMEKRLDNQFQDVLRTDQRAQFRQLLVESSAVTLLTLFAIAIALFLARSMSRSLWRLRDGALVVAYRDLPESVARLRDPETLGELTPDEVAGQVKDLVRVRGRDEIGQVAQAFNVVHREAVRIAAQQAALRASVSTLFVNLARRSQLMVDRLISHLDRLERGEEDPDRLAQLFQLDHLATRMRRNDENLLVLAGAGSSRARREAAPLGDVLRAAQSEVEQYTRIDLGVVDLGVDVTAEAVNDVVHLTAELLDNATSFSASNSPVMVEACRIGDRAYITIEDRGVGIPDEQLAELNERLANPPSVDVALTRMMGLVVVGRLAARLGATVELRPAPEGGTIAEVIIPLGALQLPRRPIQPAALPPAPEPALPPAPPQPRSNPGLSNPGPSDTGLPSRAAREPAFGPPRPYGAEPYGGGEPFRGFEPEPRQPQGQAPSQGEAPSPVAPSRSAASDLFGGRTTYANDARASRADGNGSQHPDDGNGRYADGNAGRPGPGDEPTQAQPIIPAPAPAVDQQAAVDDSPELPIFREVQSAWFRVPPAGEAPAAAPSPHAAPESPSPRPYGEDPGSAARPGTAPEPDWATAADVGWQAASALGGGRDTADVASSGLPRRQPMAQLVPGGVGGATPSAARQRSPEAVRGLLSAYSRGVQRGRAAQDTAPRPPARPNGNGA
jgi:signal transduction histidine kinase